MIEPLVFVLPAPTWWHVVQTICRAIGILPIHDMMEAVILN